MPRPQSPHHPAGHQTTGQMPSVLVASGTSIHPGGAQSLSGQPLGEASPSARPPPAHLCGKHFPGALRSTHSPWCPEVSRRRWLSARPPPPPAKGPPELQLAAWAPSPALSPGKRPLVPIWGKPPCPNMVKSECTDPGHRLESRYPIQGGRERQLAAAPARHLHIPVSWETGFKQ